MTHQLASRQSCEKELNALANDCNIVVGPDGHCKLNALVLIENVYSNFKGAMRTTSSHERPTMPVLYLKATGA
eukprot:6177943-Pleurochrysis_carterae.AAC.2